MATRKPRPLVVEVDGCKVDGCTAVRVYTRGLCALHWCGRADLADKVPKVDKVRDGR